MSGCRRENWITKKRGTDDTLRKSSELDIRPEQILTIENLFGKGQLSKVSQDKGVAIKGDIDIPSVVSL
jgi:hypothetical protein